LVKFAIVPHSLGLFLAAGNWQRITPTPGPPSTAAGLKAMWAIQRLKCRANGKTNVTRASSQAHSSSAEQRRTASVLFFLAALAALGALATNIILPAFPAMGEDLGVSVRELSATLPSFFLTFVLVGYVWICDIAGRLAGYLLHCQAGGNT